ncbi:Isoniazid-inducible protein iniC [Rhodococcus sp. D2-41]|uniref:Dynamin family protein n=1 Tax=Speluncibacter jeojiensis TaxID=2710754 RepID=A0A9X4REA5_9ACTN|nr:dynamin family protein [Rhodococcus sp. D2-41]MDG3010183.1 Isoniazid-inducible protein iniC [Rhodococcus sp. D2-41]MDG3015695.1 dynamin family protein [Corynebacteriales bacterium D3-21]
MREVTALARANDLVHTAQRAYAGDRAATEQLADCRRRIDQPLRVALAGSLKAGKSTLLNAIVGQEIAPTDATECTRVVTWYRGGPTPTVTARYDGERSANVLVQRTGGRLSFDLGALTADRVDRIEVQWPAGDLDRTTIIDTPGTSSLSKDVSDRTLGFLTPDEGGSGADAVVYLLRTLAATDIAFLERIGNRVGGESGPLGVVGVVSRADEIGAGRLDAMLSARDVAARFAGELENTGLCQSVVPVAGLLALGARTLRQDEFHALRVLAAVSAEDFQLAMLSADRFAASGIIPGADPEAHRRLVRRLGLYGIRMAVTLLRMGTTDAPSLCRGLLERSGLDELRDVLETQFGQRAGDLKAHSALLALKRVLIAHPGADSAALIRSADRLLSDTHGFEEMRMLGRLRSTATGFGADESVDLQRLLGGVGVDARVRLGLGPHASAAEQRAAAVAQVQRWRARSAHPLNDAFTTRCARTAARSAEGIVARLQ